MAGYIDVVFDGPPEAESGRFVEVEDETGASIAAGEWIERENGYWALRIATSQSEPGPDDDRQPVTVDLPTDDGEAFRAALVEELGPRELFPGTLDALDSLTIRKEEA